MGGSLSRGPQLRTLLAIDDCSPYFRSRFLVRWLSGRKQRFAKAPYPKRVPRVRIPPSPFYTNRALNRSAQVDGQVEQEIKRARAGRFQVRLAIVWRQGWTSRATKRLPARSSEIRC